jgi:hypothetical protein
MYLYKYFSERGVLRLLRTLKVRFSPPIAFNDPFECRPRFYNSKVRGDRWHFEGYGYGSPRSELELGLSNRLGFFCLTEEPLNLTMWAHYGDFHRGAVVEFDAAHRFFSSEQLQDGRENLLKKMKYRQRRPRMNLDFFRKHFDVEISGWKELLEQGHELLFVKGLDWAHEKEWRLVRAFVAPRPEKFHRWYGFDRFSYPDEHFRGLSNAGEIESEYKVPEEQIFELPPDAITSVILGARSRHDGPYACLKGLEGQIAHLMGQNPRLAHVRLEKTRLDFFNFRLIKYGLDDIDDLAKNVTPQEITNRTQGFHSGIIPRKK